MEPLPNEAKVRGVLASLFNPPAGRRYDLPVLVASLVIVCAFFAAPLFRGLGGFDLDGDEAIYAGVVNSILEGGHWSTPEYEGHPFLEKPPLKFWLVAAAIVGTPLSPDERGFRWLDSLFAALAFIYVFLLGWRLAGPVCGVGAAYFLAINQELVFVHGLRSNNMESMLVLAYTGAVYHFQRWSEGANPGRHIAAVAGWFCFSFLGKFVAALFLPLVLVSCVFAVPEWRRRARQDLPYLFLATAAACALIAPWYAYQLVVGGSGFWEFAFWHHVHRRATVGLDPAHIHPFYYYLDQLLGSYQRVWYYPCLGGLAWVVRLVRNRWWPGLTAVVWLAIPVAVLSLAASKLYHYAYPFVPPVALFGGYAVALAGRAGFTLPLSMDMRRERLERWLRPALWTLFVLTVLVFALTLFSGTGRISWNAGPLLIRNASVARPLIVAALVLVTLRRNYRAALAMILAYAIAADVQREYARFWERTTSEQHLLSSLAACMKESGASDSRDVFAFFHPGEEIKHDVRYYFRPLHRSSDMEIRRVDRRLRERRSYGPVLLTGSEWPTLVGHIRGWPIEDQAAIRVVPLLRYDAYLVLPGPYAQCAALGWPPKD